MANFFYILKILYICLLVSINPSLCMENGDSFNPSNNGQGIIALVLLVFLFGHFMYYTFKPSIFVDEEDNTMFGPEKKPIQLNSINEIDLLQFLYNWKSIIVVVLLLMLLVALVFLIRSYTSRKCNLQGDKQLYNVDSVWSRRVIFVVMSFLNALDRVFTLIYLNIRKKVKIYLFILFSISHIFCNEPINPSNNNNNTCETIFLLVFFYLFGVFWGYISDSKSKSKIKTVLDNSESTSTSILNRTDGLNSVKEIDIFQILYNLEYIDFLIIIVLLLLLSLQIKLYFFRNTKLKILIILLIALTICIFIIKDYHCFYINFEKLNSFKNLVYIFKYMLNINNDIYNY